MIVVAGAVEEAFKVSLRDRVQQRTWSRLLTFQLVVVFTVFFQARVLPHRAACLTMPMSEFKGGFGTFSRPEKSATLGPHSGSELSADFTPSTPAAYVVSDGPPTWIDGAGFTWWQSASGRWYLDRDPSIWWDAPG